MPIETTPETVPAIEYRYLALTDISTHYDPITDKTRVTIFWTKFAIDDQGNRTVSPKEPVAIVIEDFDQFATDKAGSGDVRWATTGQSLIQLAAELVQEQNAISA